MKLDRSKRILDAPSGKNGTIVNELRSLGFENVNGIDLIIEKSAQDNNPKLQEGDMSETHYDSNYFDIIFSSYGPFSYYSEAGNYAVVAQKIFTEMVRILKNDGLLFISPATLQTKNLIEEELKKNNPLIKLIKMEKLDGVPFLSDNYYIVISK